MGLWGGMNESDAATELGDPPLTSVAARRSRSLIFGGAAAIAAGVAGIVGLISSIPWPELFSLDAVPVTAVAIDPGLSAVMVGHYGILAAGGALGLLAGAMLGWGLRRRLSESGGALVIASGSAMMFYAAARRAVDVAINSGRSTVELASFVWIGGTMFLVGTVVLTLALRRRTGKLFVLLGLSAPALVTGGILMFVWVGPDVYPSIWGVTFPPPSDYLLAIWFIVLGQLARTGRLESGIQVKANASRTEKTG